MAKRGLTGNERLVLYGLVHLPTRNDRELSERIDVKVSTVTAIRRRLRRAEYFVTKRIPSMHRLGWEILAAGHVRIDPGQGPQALARLRDGLKDRLPGLFHVMASPDHVTFLAAAPDYTTFSGDVDELRQLLDRTKVLGDGDLHISVFPMTRSVVPVFFDYSHALAMGFGIEEHATARAATSKGGPVDLTRKEAEVLKGLVRFPELSDKALALRVKVSRQAVSKMRREFEEEAILRTVRLPNLRLLGFELFTAGFAHFAPTATLRARAEGTEKTLRQSPTFCVVASDADTVVLGAARNYEQFSALRQSLVRWHEERGFFRGEPTIYLGLADTTELIRHCEFAPLIGSLTERERRSGG